MQHEEVNNFRSILCYADREGLIIRKLHWLYTKERIHHYIKSCTSKMTRFLCSWLRVILTCQKRRLRDRKQDNCKRLADFHWKLSLTLWVPQIHDQARGPSLQPRQTQSVRCQKQNARLFSIGVNLQRDLA